MPQGVRLNLPYVLPVETFLGTIARWPPRPAELAVLLDLGMSGDQIAIYHDVNPSKVESLSNYYGFQLQPKTGGLLK